jgi:tetratricopeptide (TPR) repeat protein
LAAGRWSEALDELAGIRRPTAFVRAQKAVALDKLGRFEDAVREWDAVARLMPGSPDPDAAAAQVLQDQAQYARALRRLDRAIRLAPGRAELRARRARLLSIQGRFDEAGSDIEAALRAEPGRRELELEAAKISILRGRETEAERRLNALERADGGDLEPARLRGLADFRARRWAAARKRFEALARRARGRDVDAERRASFYAAAAKVLELEGPAIEGSRLALCGLGYRHPWQTSVEVVRALAACRVIYTNHSDGEVAEFISLFGAEIRPVVFRKWRSQATSCSRQVFAGVAEGGIIGFVTRGHPLFFGALAEKMVLRARRDGVPCRVFGSVSLAETALSLAANPGPGRKGLHVVDGRILCEGKGLSLPWNTVPAVVYNIGEPGQRRKLALGLGRLFPEGRDCYLFAGSGADEYVAARRTVGQLPEALERADDAVTVFVPAGPA